MIPLFLITFLIFCNSRFLSAEKTNLTHGTKWSRNPNTTKINTIPHWLCPCPRNISSIPSKQTMVDLSLPVESVYILPDSVWPVEYQLSMKVDFNELKKSLVGKLFGNVTIKVLIKNETDEIYLNAFKTIKLDSVSVRKINSSNSETDLVENFFYENTFLIKIKLTANLTVGEHYSIEFNNFKTLIYINQDSGIITRRYENPDKTHEFMMATQFQPDSGRAVFPCFDEPRFKTSFQLNITTNKEYRILTNMPEISCEHENGSLWKSCSFETTPVMPLYNLAFAIVDFNYLEKFDEKGRQFRIWTRKSQIKHAEFALNMTVKAFEVFEKHFNIDFPLMKIDSLAIPNLKGFLGMEHYGLITYDEPVVIWNKQFPLTYSKMLCVSIVCHEVAHQWFGNLVTTKWWKDLWLNEGFATYFAYRMGKMLLKDDLYYTLEYLSIFNYVKNFDDYFTHLKSTVSAPVDTFVEDKFGYLSYKKGFLVVHMIEKVLGTKDFDLALENYLRTNKYGSVTPSDLWKSISKRSKFTVKNIIEDWLNKVCYPIVQVRASGNKSISLTQRASINFNSSLFSIRFNGSTTNTWNVPLYIIYGNNVSQVNTFFYNFKKENILNLDKFSPSSNWVLVNVNYSSFLAIDYDDITFEKLSLQMLKNHEIIPPISRAQIMQDYYDLSKKYKRNNLHHLLKLLTYLKRETDPIPMTTGINLLDKLHGLLELRSFYPTWKRYLTFILKPTLDKLVKDFLNNFQNGDTMYHRLSPMILNFACRLRFEQCFKITDIIIDRWKNKTLLPTDYDLLHIAICKYIEMDDDNGKRWSSLYSSYEFQSWDYINVKYYAMGCSKVPWIMEKNVDISYNILKNYSNRNKFPHVSRILIDRIPPDYLHGTTPISSLLIFSFIYNTPNAINLITRFNKDCLTLIYDSLYFPHHFPLPKSLVEHAIPTLSHYKFLLGVYHLKDKSRNTILDDAKANIDWILRNNNLERNLNVLCK